jgi:hypothetical protein
MSEVNYFNFLLCEMITDDIEQILTWYDLIKY